MHKSFIVRAELCTVRFVIFIENFILRIVSLVLFRNVPAPQNILIYKVGNIGDIVCAVPALIAIRRNYPEAKITLLTSPGKRGSPGAKELLENAWYLNDLKVYYRDDIDTSDKRKKFIQELRAQTYDMFIQLPDDLANFRTLVRNMIFAKMIGAEYAFGFTVRTIQLFKKAQVDFTEQETEVQSLLGLLRRHGIKAGEIEFDFNVPAEDKLAVADLVKKNRIRAHDLVVALSPGGKREGNQWPTLRFRAVTEHLSEAYGARIIVAGGDDDKAKAQTILQGIPNSVNAAGAFSFLGTLELLKQCSFLISNSTGTIHLAAAAGIPAVGLYTIRDVPGRWFPFGDAHIVLCHRLLRCDYQREECIAASLVMISVDEVIEACKDVIGKLHFDK